MRSLLLLFALFCAVSSGISAVEVETSAAGSHLRSGATDATMTSVSVAGMDANGNDGLPVSRTATGGIINTLLSFLTVIAFIGNGAFMVYTFWLSK